MATLKRGRRLWRDAQKQGQESDLAAIFTPIHALHEMATGERSSGEHFSTDVGDLSIGRQHNRVPIAKTVLSCRWS